MGAPWNNFTGFNHLALFFLEYIMACFIWGQFLKFWFELWNLAKIVKVGQNCEIWPRAAKNNKAMVRITNEEKGEMRRCQKQMGCFQWLSFPTNRASNDSASGQKSWQTMHFQDYYLRFSSSKHFRGIVQNTKIPMSSKSWKIKISEIPLGFLTKA